MARPKPWEISDELWVVIAPILPSYERRFRYPGRRRIEDRSGHSLAASARAGEELRIAISAKLEEAHWRWQARLADC